jgi:pyridoxamine 5'-phosphate oxidase
VTSERTVAELRREYTLAGLHESDLAPSWHEQFARWFRQAVELREPNAMVVATAADGRPSVRTVLLKGHDERGLVFYTNLTSRKGRELLGNPHAAAVFPWVDLERQVHVEGVVEQVPRTDTERYFRSRPRGAQVAAWASRQSTVLRDRAELEQRWGEREDRFAGREVPVPEFWGGLRVVPTVVEFWQGRANRLHDRLRYRSTGDGWVVERLAP